MRNQSSSFSLFQCRMCGLLSLCSFPLVDGDVACGRALWHDISLNSVRQCVCVCVCVCCHCLSLFIPRPVATLLSLFYFCHTASPLLLFLLLFLCGLLHLSSFPFCLYISWWRYRVSVWLWTLYMSLPAGWCNELAFGKKKKTLRIIGLMRAK